MRPRVAQAILVSVCALGSSPPAVAQNADPERNPTSATLPESNEAMLLSDRAEEAIRRGDYRLAIRLAEQIMDLPNELVAARASRTYYPVWRQAVRLMSQLPPDGVELYRRLYDAEVKSRLQEASRSSDFATLHELFLRHRASSAWFDIGSELAARLLDRGDYGDVIEVIREMRATKEGDTLERRAQLVVALTRVGAAQAADRLLRELEADRKRPLPPRWAARIEALRTWVEANRRYALGEDSPLGERATFARAEPFRPVLDTPAPWARQLRPRGESLYPYDPGQLAGAIDRHRRLPLYRAVVDADVLAVRLDGQIRAFDALTLTPLWTAPELAPDGARSGSAAWDLDIRRGRGERDPTDGSELSPSVRTLITDALRHSLSTGFGLVLTVESLSSNLARGTRGGGRFQPGRDGPWANVLVARDLKSGRVVWRAGHEPAHPLHGVAFQDAPAVVGETLVVPVQRRNELHVCALDPKTGDLILEAAVVGPPTYFTSNGGRCLVAIDETTVYVCTGNGVIAALDRDDLSWKWATIYPSTLGEHLNSPWWEPTRTPRESGVDRPVIVDDLLVVAPLDSTVLVALDRFSGRERWRVPRGEYAFVVGALTVYPRAREPGDATTSMDDTIRSGLVVGGTSIACLDPADGRTLRWRSVPLEITGRPAIRGQRVFVPTRTGVVVIDGRSGKVVADQIESFFDGSATTGPRVANLFATSTALLSLSPDRLVKYPDLAASRARCRVLLEANENDERARLTSARLDTAEGQYAAALARLETLQATDEAIASDRDRLLTDVLVALASESGEGEQRIAWLRRAAALSTSPEVSTRLSVLIGGALEDAERSAEALDHYQELALRPESGIVRDAADPHRRLSVWAWAVQRMQHGLGRLSDQERAERLASLIDEACAAGAKSVLLQRVRNVLSPGVLLDRVDRELTLQRLPAELAVQFLPRKDDAQLSQGLRRRLHLHRWETHVALGMLDAARDDREVWRARFAEAEIEPDERAGMSADAERRRVRGIETSIRKLEQSAGVPFRDQFIRQWKIEKAELIVDRLHPERTMRPWMLLRNRANEQLVLYCGDRRTELRETRDGLMVGPAVEADKRAARDGVLFGGAGGPAAGSRTTWPVVTYGRLAAVPVRRGLVGVGLGPERHAGQRLFEAPVRDWSEIPENFVETAVAGPLGVYFCPRGDRVVMLDWSDGKLRWQREWPGRTIQRLFLAGNRLVVVTHEHEVVSVDATFGHDVRRLPTELGTPKGVEVVADTLVIWVENAIVGFDPRTLRRIWSGAARGVDSWVSAPELGWIAFRERAADDWRLLDARTGRRVFDDGLGAVGEITAIGVGERALYVAARPRNGENGEVAPAVVAAFDRASGRPLWSQTVEGVLEVNRTQLLAHETYIPLLVGDSADGERGTLDLSTLSILLLDKKTGEIVSRAPIGNDRMKRRKEDSGVYMFVTPTRMIVQAAGNLLAFGSSPLDRGP